MARNNSLTITPQESKIEPPEPKTIAIQRQQETKIGVALPQAQALLIQELQISFDADLCSAMLKRLIDAQQQINALATEEQRLAKSIELSRLAAVEQAKLAGVQIARQEFAEQLKEQNLALQKKFISIDLPKLIETCKFLPEADMRLTVEKFAASAKVEVRWEETDAGLQCTATPIKIPNS